MEIPRERKVTEEKFLKGGYNETFRSQINKLWQSIILRFVPEKGAKIRQKFVFCGK
jgi:hypothetical protein